MLYLRNKQTGEIREVEDDSPEFIALKNQVGPDGRSLWEQTGDHHVGALAERVEEGALREEDLGHEDQPLAPLKVDTNAVGPAVAPWKELTAAEREAGLDEDAKAEQVSDDIEAAAAARRGATLEEAADKIGSSISNEFPVDTPPGTNPADSEGGSSRSSGGPSKADLQAEAEARGLSTSGNKADIQARIEEYDRENVNQ